MLLRSILLTGARVWVELTSDLTLAENVSCFGSENICFPSITCLPAHFRPQIAARWENPDIFDSV